MSGYMNDRTSEDGRRRGVFDVDEDRALDALRMSWGDVYDIGHEYDRWVASRRTAAAARSPEAPRMS